MPDPTRSSDEAVQELIDRYFDGTLDDNDKSHRTEVYPFITWSRAFVRRWGMVPQDGGRRAVDYIAQQGLDETRITLVEALRAFHVADWRINQDTVGRYMAMERDYDRVPPRTQEWPMEEGNWRRMEQQQDRLNPNHPSQRGRVFIPRGGGKL